ncbi:MAG: glycosyltransferase family 2 protein [Eubacteriales bacterium]|nr:glycosyltransferase family 2 protein [Eubacteriales bacterium]
MENVFVLQNSRFCVRDPRIFVLQGHFMENLMGDGELNAYLDGRKLPVRLGMRQGIAIRQKYINVRTKAAYIDREYDLWITLPEGLEKAKRLEVYQEQQEKRQRVYRTSVRDLLRRQREPESYLESWKEEDGKILAGGWVASDSPSRIRVMGSDGKKIAADVKWHCRPDVLQSFPELLEETGDQREPALGFEVSFEKPSCRQAAIVVQTKNQKKAYRMPVRRIGKKGFAGSAKTVPYIEKAAAYYKRNGLKRTLKRCGEKLFYGGNTADYRKWRKGVLPSKEELKAQRAHMFETQPLISIAVPLYRTPEKYLRELVASVQAQTYEKWELCLSDGSGADSPLAEILEELQKKDARIRVASASVPLGISENTNEALKIARGDFVAFADHDDLLSEDALYECVRIINEHPAADFIYSDEDKVSMNGREYFQPHFKPDFNIDLLCSMNYICHLVMVKRELLEKVGMLDSAYNGAQDYDFVLRCVETAEKVCHIPKVLYHWRAHKDSTAENPESKRYAFEAGARAVQAHYDRLGMKAKVIEGEYPGLYRTIYAMPEEKPLVSVIIPNKDHREDLDKCLQSVWQKSSYENIEFVIVENNSTEQETFAYYDQVQREHANVRVIYWKDEFNYSLINNFGAEEARGEYLLFLNNDVEMINPDCIEELLGPCLREDVGCVGARLYYPDDTIQHAGVIIGFGGIAGHAFIGSMRGDNGYFSRIICAADLSAVTAACMMVKRKVFEQAQGFDGELKVAFNDIDFCLRVRENGKLVVYNPFAELYHYESRSRGYEDTPEKVARFNKEADVFLKKWEKILENGDPAYNPNLTLDRSDFALR